MECGFEQRIFKLLHPEAEQWFSALEVVLEQVDEENKGDVDIDKVREEWRNTIVEMSTFRMKRLNFVEKEGYLRKMAAECLEEHRDPNQMEDKLDLLLNEQELFEKEAVWTYIIYVGLLRTVSLFLARSSIVSSVRFRNLTEETLEYVAKKGIAYGSSVPVRASGP